MKTVAIEKANLPLSDYTKKLKKEPVVITREGTPVAAIVSISNADVETVSLSNNPKFLSLVERSRANQRAQGGFSSDQMRQRLKGDGRKKRKKVIMA